MGARHPVKAGLKGDTIDQTEFPQDISIQYADPAH